jgi:hypothetical protein
VIGGLLCATVATLIFVPAVFGLLHGAKKQDGASTKEMEHSFGNHCTHSAR